MNMERATTPLPIVVFDINQLSTGMDLSRAHRGSQGEKKDKRMTYKQGGSIRRETTPKQGIKRPDGGNQNNGNGGPRSH